MLADEGRPPDDLWFRRADAVRAGGRGAAPLTRSPSAGKGARRGVALGPWPAPGLREAWETRKVKGGTRRGRSVSTGCFCRPGRALLRTESSEPRGKSVSVSCRQPAKTPKPETEAAASQPDAAQTVGGARSPPSPSSFPSPLNPPPFQALTTNICFSLLSSCQPALNSLSSVSIRPPPKSTSCLTPFVKGVSKLLPAGQIGFLTPAQATNGFDVFNWLKENQKKNNTL